MVESNSFLCSAKTPAKKAIVVAGPTASGKSALALALAEKFNGVIINADSMQVYRDVPTLTARPMKKETTRIEHCLYGFLEPREVCSAFKWAELAANEMTRIWNENRLPVIVGGTGLYIQTLQQGISPVPEVNTSIRQAVRERFEAIGKDEFLRDFQEKDKDFTFTDPQRLLRAAEVIEQTGKSITYWQAQPYKKVIEAEWFNILIDLPRELLYERCNARFDQMMQGNALEEVEALNAKNPPKDSLIMKAIGVRELTAFLNNEITKEEAVFQAQQMTRNYAKRQVTWFKHRFNADETVLNDKTEQILTNVLHFLQ